MSLPINFTTRELFVIIIGYLFICICFRRDSVNDIARIEVYPPFEASSYVYWAQIPPANAPSSGNCIITGWGSTENEINSDILQKVLTLVFINGIT